MRYTNEYPHMLDANGWYYSWHDYYNDHKREYTQAAALRKEPRSADLATPDAHQF